MKDAPLLIRKISSATLSFYSPEKKKKLLSKIEVLINLLDKNPEIHSFFQDFSLDTQPKREILDNILKKLEFDEIFCNAMHLLLDRNLIFYFLIFLNHIKEDILDIFNIKNVYIYSSIPINGLQKKRLENIWAEKLSCNCIFHYFLDESLKMGIKVQVDNYIEEYSVGSQLERLKNDFFKSFN